MIDFKKIRMNQVAFFHRFVIFVSLFAFAHFSFSQNFDENIPIVDTIQNEGSIRIIQDSSVNNLLNRQLLLNKKQDGIPNGYRIQVFSVSGNDAREKAIEFKEKFLEYHTEFEREQVYQLYQPPFFKLRVGDYRNKHEALLVYKKLVQYYPNCYIVKSKVNFPKLKE